MNYELQQKYRCLQHNDVYYITVCFNGQIPYNSSHYNSTGSTNKTSRISCSYAPFELIEYSVKSGKHSTSTLSLVQKCQPPRGTNSEMHHFLCQTEFHPILTRLYFFLSASTGATYIFTTPTCTTTIITSNCALNAEFQHFIPRFNKTSLLCGPHSKMGQGVKRGPKTG